MTETMSKNCAYIVCVWHIWYCPIYRLYCVTFCNIASCHLQDWDCNCNLTNTFGLRKRSADHKTNDPNKTNDDNHHANANNHNDSNDHCDNKQNSCHGVLHIPIGYDLFAHLFVLYMFLGDPCSLYNFEVHIDFMIWGDPFQP